MHYKSWPLSLVYYKLIWDDRAMVILEQLLDLWQIILKRTQTNTKMILWQIKYYNNTQHIKQFFWHLAVLIFNS